MREECPEKRIIMELALGALEGHQEREAREHVTSCDECRAELNQIEETAGLLRRAAHAAPHERVEGCPDGEALLAYADGSLRGEAAHPVEAHLAVCPACLSELADVWKLSGDEIADVSDDAVARVLTRLGTQGRVAIVSLARETISVVRDFARAATAAVEGLAPRPAAALAAASRAGGDRIMLSWEGPGDLAIESRLSLSGSGLSMIGRVTCEGAPVSGVSIAHDAGAQLHGPESPDADGRFGPWELPEGANRITLSGSRIPGGSVALTIDVRVDDETEPPDS